MKKNISIRFKLNILITGIILLVSISLVFVYYRVHCETVDERNFELVRKAAVSSKDYDFINDVRQLRETILTESFQELRREALDAQDPEMIRNYLDGIECESRYSATLLESVENVGDTLMVATELFGVDTIYLQFDQNGVTYNLVDPCEDIFWIGSIEESIYEFEEYEDNVRIPPTVYHSVYGWRCTACEPVQDPETGEPIYSVGADVDMNQVIQERHEFFFQSILLVLILTVLAILISTLMAKRMITHPLRQLSEATKAFAHEENGCSRDSVANLDIRSQDEIGELYRDIRSMEERIVVYTENLTRITAERERTETELRTAAGIQMSVLPEISESISERPEFELAASMSQAKEVGGDFYDFFFIDGDHLALVIADVSDKGVPAALFMMSSKILLNYRARLGGSPSEILSAVNAELCRNNPTDMFVTVWLGILELSTGRLCCCNAGHEYPFLRQNGRFALYKDKHALMVGAREGVRYRDCEIQLSPGDAIFVYTDGVPEAKNAENDFFGLERTEQVLNNAEKESAEGILDAIRQVTDAFRGEAQQFDDLTMLCVIYKGRQ